MLMSHSKNLGKVKKKAAKKIAGAMYFTFGLRINRLKGLQTDTYLKYKNQNLKFEQKLIQKEYFFGGVSVSV